MIRTIAGVLVLMLLAACATPTPTPTPTPTATPTPTVTPTPTPTATPTPTTTPTPIVVGESWDMGISDYGEPYAALHGERSSLFVGCLPPGNRLGLAIVWDVWYNEALLFGGDLQRRRVTYSIDGVEREAADWLPRQPEQEVDGVFAPYAHAHHIVDALLAGALRFDGTVGAGGAYSSMHYFSFIIGQGFGAAYEPIRAKCG